jgi:hypothetical protein
VKKLYTESEVAHKVNEAVDSVMLPFLVELVGIGITQEQIETAMNNVLARRAEDDNSAEG